MPNVLNAHHYGGSDKIPPGSVMVDRTTLHGNKYSHKSGDYSKEESVSLHRVDLYTQLTQDSTLLAKLRQELGGKDLVCWCKHASHVKPCHAENYLHVLSDACKERDYTKSVSAYLVSDIRLALQKLDHKLLIHDPAFYNQRLDLAPTEVRCEINEMIRLAKERKLDTTTMNRTLAYVVIDLELALQETTPLDIDFRLWHAVWQCYRLVFHYTTRSNEPERVVVRKPKISQTT